MAKWTSFYKIVEPKTPSETIADNTNFGDHGAYGNYTWYSRLIQGSSSRMTRYREYDLMDSDVEVSRALDTIAEEMTGNTTKTDEPLLIDITDEDEEQLNNTTILTIKAALRHWTEMHNWENRLYSVARNLIKYGDVFFKRKGDYQRWE